MNCKNCNYILTGKENFCPNCGTIPESASTPFPKIKEIREAPQKKPSAEKPKTLNEILFFDPTDDKNDAPEEKYFPETEAVQENFPIPVPEIKEKNPIGKIFLLLFICCTLAVSAFGLADYFGILPRFKAYISTFSQKKPVTYESTTTTAFSHSNTVVQPDTNCDMKTAYVFSGSGLPLRKGPSNSYAPLYNLTDLTMVQIFGSSLSCPEWIYVYCPEKDTYGWLNGSFVCSDVVMENKITDEYETEEDVPASYYYEGQM